MNFEQPLWFLLLLFIPLLIYLSLKGRRGLVYPSLETLPDHKTLRIRLFFIRDLLFYLSLAVLIVAGAGPYRYAAQKRDYSQGRLLQLVVDRSGSMQIFMDRRGSRNRLDLVKEVLTLFIKGDGQELRGRRNDRIGLIAFARYPNTMAPLTASHDIVVDLVDTLSFPPEEEDGTAIGDALALGVARTVAFQKRVGVGSASSVIILLTDGQNNQGKYSPLEAAELAREQGIKVYTIALGGGFRQGFFGFLQEIPPDYGIDVQILQKIANLTGGRYFNAGDEKTLYEVYSQIDTLEKLDLEDPQERPRELYFPRLLHLALFLLLLTILARYILFNLVEES